MSGTTGTIPLQPWADDQLITKEVLNGENTNIGSLMDAKGCGGHSDTDTDAQLQTNPFPGSVLSKATSIAGELERLRYQMAQMLGTDFWYKPAATDLTTTGEVITPVGGVIDYPVQTPPNAKWHLADGTTISRAGFPVLFALIGTTFGVGDGSTTFNLPNYTDRMAIAAGNLYAAGATGGAASGALSITDPGHTHTQAGHAHTTTGNTGVESADTPAAGGAGSLPNSNHTHSVNLASNTITPVINSTTTGISGTVATLPPYLGMFKLMRVS